MSQVYFIYFSLYKCSRHQMHNRWVDDQDAFNTSKFNCNFLSSLNAEWNAECVKSSAVSLYKNREGGGSGWKENIIVIITIIILSNVYTGCSVSL